MMSTHRRTLAATIIAGLLATSAMTAGVLAADAAPSTSAPGSAPRLVLDYGHIDLFEVTYDEDADAFELNLKDDTGIYTRERRTAYRDPERVVLQAARKRSRLVLPEGLEQEWYDLLGEPGTAIYHLGEVQEEGLPWPGWSTERLLGQLAAAGIELTPSDYPAYSGTPALDLELDISGPGEVITWMNDSVPIHNFIDTRDPELDTIPVPVGSHVHTSWGFTEPGLYTIKVTPHASKVGGGTLTGPEATYRINIGGKHVRSTRAPKLDGAVRVGSRVKVTPGTWAPERPVVRYEWTIGDIEVEPRQNNRYVLPAKIGNLATTGLRLRVVAVARAEGRETTRVTVADRVIRRR